MHDVSSGNVFRRRGVFLLEVCGRSVSEREHVYELYGGNVCQSRRCCVYGVSSGNVFRREGIVLHEVYGGYVFERRQFLQCLRRRYLLQRRYGGMSEVSGRYCPEREQDGLHGLQRGNVCGFGCEHVFGVS